MKRRLACNDPPRNFVADQRVTPPRRVLHEHEREVHVRHFEARYLAVSDTERLVVPRTFCSRVSSAIVDAMVLPYDRDANADRKSRDAADERESTDVSHALQC